MHWLVVAPRVGDDKRLRKVDRERERNEKHDQPSAEGQAAHRTGKAAAREIKKRTLTNLYNQRPQWLANAHANLDSAVAAAYGWPADISEKDALGELLEMNLARSG